MTGIERLSKYRQHQARIRVLSTYHVGCGLMLASIGEEDELQQLHKRLRGLPSYMYLSQHEQDIEMAARVNLERYPSGLRAQLAAVPEEGNDAEETELLDELRRKIRRIIKARGGERRDIDDVIERLTEMQDLQAEIERLDLILSQLETYRPDAAKLLRVHYVEGKAPDEAASELGIVRQTFYTWRKEAAAEFDRLAM